MQTTPTLATRAEFLTPAKRRFKNLTLPVSGQAVRIRSLMEGEKEAYEADLLNPKGGVKFDKLRTARRRLVQLCLVDADGNPLLEPSDIDKLTVLDGADLGYLQDECMVHCGFKEGDIEGLVKNSDAVHAA